MRRQTCQEPPDVVIRADAAAVRMGSPAETRGAAAVAGTFSGRARGAEPALVDGAWGFMWAPGGRAKVVWDVVVADGRIVHIDMLADAETLDRLDLVPDAGRRR